jgi:hypothetical protein
MTSTPDASEAGAVPLVWQRTDAQAAGSAADNTSVPTDAGLVQDDERGPKADFAYTPEERTAIDQANAAFAPIIEAIDKLEDIEAWVPPLVKGVRALRDRAMRETGALNYVDQQYRTRFGDLLNAEPFGPWLLDKDRSSLRDAIHYLGSDDTYLASFMEWWQKLTDEQRRKWRNSRTLVDHFKKWQRGTVPNRDRRTPDQKEIELVRTEGHKAEAALLAEVEQTRRELATGTTENSETLWTVLDQAGPEKLVQSLRDHDAKDYARIARKLINAWLDEEPAA